MEHPNLRPGSQFLTKKIESKEKEVAEEIELIMKELSKMEGCVRTMLESGQDVVKQMTDEKASFTECSKRLAGLEDQITILRSGIREACSQNSSVDSEGDQNPRQKAKSSRNLLMGRIERAARGVAAGGEALLAEVAALRRMVAGLFGPPGAGGGGMAGVLRRQLQVFRVWEAVAAWEDVVKEPLAMDRSSGDAPNRKIASYLAPRQAGPRKPLKSLRQWSRGPGKELRTAEDP
jgi:hypothetical protein